MSRTPLLLAALAGLALAPLSARAQALANPLGEDPCFALSQDDPAVAKQTAFGGPDTAFAPLASCESLCNKAGASCARFVNRAAACERRYVSDTASIQLKTLCAGKSQKDCADAANINGAKSDALDALDAARSAELTACSDRATTCLEACNASP